MAKLKAGEARAALEALTAYCIRGIDPRTPPEVMTLGRDLHSALRYPPNREPIQVIREVLDRRAAANSQPKSEEEST